MNSGLNIVSMVGIRTHDIVTSFQAIGSASNNTESIKVILKINSFKIYVFKSGESFAHVERQEAVDGHRSSLQRDGRHHHHDLGLITGFCRI